jgi:C_GCAxxG_C_C family probable redox protein
MKTTRMDDQSLIPSVLDAVQNRAENLFLTRQLHCAEAVMAVLNQGLGGGLPPELALRLTSALPEGLGRRGCLCGALNGGVLALGLFLGRSRPGYRNGTTVHRAVGELHDQFKATFKATCCRVLTKSLPYGSDLHFQHCSRITGQAARLAAAIVLDRKPELVESADWSYLERTDHSVTAGLKKIFAGFGR